MADAASNQKQEIPKQETAKQEAPKGRIPVQRIWLREPIDVRGGSGTSGMTVIDCTPPKLEGRQFFVAHFNPAHQVIELEFYRNEKMEPVRKRIPMANVRDFD